MMPFLLPDGTSTKSTARYVKAWRDLAKPIEKLTGMKCYGFDPHIALIGDDNTTCEVPTSLALKIGEAIVRETLLEDLVQMAITKLREGEDPTAIANHLEKYLHKSKTEG